MKIVVVLSRVPYPLEKGDKLRAYHQLTLLAARHEVMLCCLSDKNVKPEHEEHLRGIVQHLEIIRLNKLGILWRLFLGIFSDKPFQVNYFFQRSAARKMRRIIEKFEPDHIYCQLIRCSEYVKNLHRFQKTLDYMDALNAGHLRRIATAPFYLRFLLRIESRRLVAYENLIFDYFEHHTIISRQDQQLIYHPKRNSIAIIPNGIDTVFFTGKDSDKKYDLLLTGNMSYPPNVDSAVFLAREVLPLIQKHRPQTTLLIAGANPTKAVSELANSSVFVSGWIDDIRDAYNSAAIFVAPLRIGSGMQNKLLEAMSMELPCITSTLAAMAIGGDSGQFLVIADQAEEIARQALLLINSPEESSAKGKAGRQYIRRKFNWEKTVNDLEQIFFGPHINSKN